jgi:outer membrane protein OmpA-like peptidoglycan-associated protein
MSIQTLFTTPSRLAQRRDILRWGVALGLATLAPLARAQAVKMYGAAGAPSPQEVADILSNGARARMKQRGVRMADGSPAPVVDEPQRPTDDAAQASAFAMPIPFGFDSARLEPAARELLSVVAEGIKLTEGTFKIVVEGHTDAHGRAGYNERLSLRRADAVRRYFVEQHGLSADLLMVEGHGPRKPIAAQNPFASENRRVQFRAA